MRTNDTVDIVCPHCGYRDPNSWECDLHGDEVEDQECGRCQKWFKVYCEVRRTFSTEKIDDQE